jgi:hypothetical protein
MLCYLLAARLNLESLRGRLAGDARVRQPGRDRGGHLQVPGRLRLVPGQLARVDAVTGELAVEQAARRAPGTLDRCAMRWLDRYRPGSTIN